MQVDESACEVLTRTGPLACPRHATASRSSSLSSGAPAADSASSAASHTGAASCFPPTPAAAASAAASRCRNSARLSPSDTAVTLCSGTWAQSGEHKTPARQHAFSVLETPEDGVKRTGKSSKKMAAKS